MGTGNSGSVFNAKLSNQAVAVKILRNCASNTVKILQKELQALAAIGSHENVLHFIGASKLENRFREFDLFPVVFVA